MIETIKRIFKKKYVPNGKRTMIEDETVIKIWKNNKPIDKFCEENDLTRSKYYRIKSWRKYVTNKDDRKRFEALEKDL